jgi:hypothetical protein
MASENNRLLQRVLAPALKRQGFKKSGATWWKDNGATIAVLNLQGSQWGPSFYINLGIYFRALGTLERPTESRCHIRARLEGLLPDRKERERMIELLDFDRPIPGHIRGPEIESLVLTVCLPWLETVSTIEGARDYCASVHPRHPFVSKDARALLAGHGSN